MQQDTSVSGSSRRGFIKNSGVIAGATAGMVLGACGGGSSDAGASSPAVSPKPQAIPWGAATQVAGGSRTGAMDIAVREFGNPAGKPILFIHGFSQSMQCWNHQMQAPELAGYRLVAMDLRGHGDSGRGLPAGWPTQGYLSADFADDVAAVIAAKGLVKPVIVAWSYGGYVLGDYLKAYGSGNVGGLNFCGAVSRLESTHTTDFVGPVFLSNAVDWLNPNWPDSIKGTLNFLGACTSTPMSADDFATAVAFNIAVPWTVRVAAATRPDEFYDQTVFKTMAPVPTVVSHGTLDQVILFGSGQAIAAAIPGARLSRYEGLGHMVFAEDAGRFNTELAALRASV